MAKLTYNGVTLEISDTQSVLRECIYSEDTQTYLYTRWLFHVACIYNPFATSSLAGVAMPAVTDAAVRNALSLPRKTLTYVDEAGNTILTSPAAGFTCDARGGPYVRVNQIRKIWGSRSWLVVFAVETFVNEQSNQNPQNGNNNPKNVVLSHRWDRFEEVDVDHYATFITRGVVVFDRGQLEKVQKNPDQFRREFPHPLRNNCRREVSNVHASSEGNTIYYTIIDKEQPVNLLTNNPTRFEAYHTSGCSRPSAIDAAWQMQLSTIHRSIDTAYRTVKDPTAIVGNLADSAVGMARESISRMAAMLPQYWTHCIVRAWGDRNALRKNLMDFCLHVCFNRLNITNVLSLNNFAGVETSITHALHEKYVEVQSTVKHGPNPVTYYKVFNIYKDFPDSDDVTVGDGTVIASAGDGPGQNLPNSNGTRGTALCQVVSQILETQGSVPPAPSVPDANDQSFR